MCQQTGIFEAEAVEIDTGNSSSNDSNYGDSLQSDTTSIKSSMLEYTFENGRRYQRGIANYGLPNDEAEQDRLDLYHHTQLLQLGGKLFLAPIGKNPQNVLDLGTGTGIWALDMAETFPSAKVIGVDISPIQPTWIFPNVKFEIDDIGQDWTWRKDHFDFIHSRNLVMGIRDWPKYLKQIHDHLVPGGYIELVEHDLECFSDDDSLKGSDISHYFDKFAESAAVVGLKILKPTDYKKLVEDAGFVDVELHMFKQPLGGWPKARQMKEIGILGCMVGEAGLESHAVAMFTKALGMTVGEVQGICARAFDDMRYSKKKGIHGYLHMYHVVGRKATTV